MKNVKLFKFLFGAFLVLSVANVSAQDMKCGAGKCGGSSMVMPKAMMKCGGGACCDEKKPKTKEDIKSDLKDQAIKMMMQQQVEEKHEYKRGSIATH
ncbi:hypothetical protein N9A28_08415 [Sulfurimonas sp.]|nr:hypothetical protein [Sulfurimonas sp.]